MFKYKILINNCLNSPNACIAESVLTLQRVADNVYQLSIFREKKKNMRRSYIIYRR